MTEGVPVNTSTTPYRRPRAGSARPRRRRALAVLGLVLPVLVVFGAAPSAAAEPVAPTATETDATAAPTATSADASATEAATAAPATPPEDVPTPSPAVTPSASPEPGPTPDPPASGDSAATPAAGPNAVTAHVAGTTAPSDAEPATATQNDAATARTAESRQPAPMVAAAAAAPRLGTAGTFAILAGSTITNSGRSVVTGDVGLHPGSAVTGFASCTAAADCVDHTGSLHVTDGVAQQAKADLLTAYDSLVGLEGTCTPLVVELGGTTLTPGVYCSPTFGLTGTLTLSGIGEFVFLTGAGGSSLTTAADSAVRLIDGADSCDVYWQVASSAALGTRTAFAGNILARTSISFGADATLDGSALALDAAVTLISNTITDKACAADGETTPPPDGTESTSPTGGATTPPPADGGATTPPPDDGGATPPPDDGGPDDDGAVPGDGNAPPQDPGALPGVAIPGGSGAGGTGGTGGTGGAGSGGVGAGATRGGTGFGNARQRLAATGASVDLQLLLAGLTLGLGALLVRISAGPRRRGRHRVGA